MSNNNSQQQMTDNLSFGVNNIKISSDDPRTKIGSWLGKVLKFTITDERIIVGYFVCTDRDGNTILDNSWEYSKTIDDNDEPRILGLALIPGKHIVSVELMINPNPFRTHGLR